MSFFLQSIPQLIAAKLRLFELTVGLITPLDDLLCDPHFSAHFVDTHS